MAAIVLEGKERTEFGKGAARRMRVAGLIPATIYAGGNQPVYVELPMRDTTNALRHTNALYQIKFGDQTKHAVVKDVQRNPVKRIIEHIDFYEVVAGEKITVEVPVFVEGTPKGAAVAFVDIQELAVRADVTNLPERIVVSVDGLQDGDKVFAKDVKLPEGAELAEHVNPEESVVTVEVPEEDVPEPAADTTAAPADAAAPAADAPAAKA
jgi:large subunit ribosomal protein L25